MVIGHKSIGQLRKQLFSTIDLGFFDGAQIQTFHCTLENVVLHWDFTSQTLASFLSDLVGACLPQTLLIIRALWHEWNGVSCLHNFTEELSNRQEVQ